MHSVVDLLLFFFAVASPPGVGANGFTPNNRSTLFGQQRQAVGLLGALADNSPLAGAAANALTAVTGGLLQNGLLADLQFFTEALGGVKAPSITMSNDKMRPYTVQGETFTDYPSAANRACTMQYTGCSDKANQNSGAGGGSNNGGSSPSSSSTSSSPSSNSDGKGKGRSDRNGNDNGSGNGKNRKGQKRRRAFTNNTVAASQGPANTINLDTALSNKASNGLTVDGCKTQLNKCNTVQRNAPFQTFNLDNVGPDPNMPDFDLLCSAPDAT